MITPNHLTAFRILLAFVCPLLLLFQRSMTVELITVLAFTVASLTDWWDGYLARTRLMVTQFGKIIDPIADKLLVLGLMSVFSHFRLYPWEWVILISAREVIVTATRLIRLAKGEVLPAEWAGKIKVGFQIGSVYATFVYLFALDSGYFVFQNSIVLSLFQGIHYAGIALAAFLTLISGILFFQRLDAV